MSKILVAYFSATGTTADAARRLAGAVKGDLFEIRPAVPYTAADLDWTDKHSRSTLEMKDPASRPEVSSHVGNMDQYDTVFVGFPIWWYVAPTIINTFLDEYDFSGKTVIPFATSGGSGMGKTLEGLKKSCNGNLVPGSMFNRSTSLDELRRLAGAVSAACKRNISAEKFQRPGRGCVSDRYAAPAFVGRFGGVNRDLSGRRRPYSLWRPAFFIVFLHIVTCFRRHFSFF